MTYTVHITVPAGPWPGGRATAPWDEIAYDTADDALEVARDAFLSRDRRRDVLVLDQDGETFDLFKAEPSARPAPADAGDSRPVHFTRTETQHMIARLTEWTRALPEPVAEVADLLAERLADTDRMLDAWDADQDDESYTDEQDRESYDAGPDIDVETAPTPEGRALLARAVDIIENGADMVRDDDTGDRSAEVKRLVRALPDGPTLHRLAETFTAEASEVFDETDEDRAYLGDPVRHAFTLLPEDYTR